MDLAGRNVLITGASRGVGAALVEAALHRDAGTVYAGARGQVLPSWSDPSRVMPVRLDVGDEADIARAATEILDVDLIVCNAGVTSLRPVLDRADEAVVREVFEVNFFGPLRLMRAFGDTLRQRAGGAIFILSVAAVALSRSAPIYSASKAACLMLGLGVREELREHGATVTMVLPGFIDTDMGAGFTGPKASPSQIAQRALDGWLAGEATVWPDRFAELVRDSLGDPPLALLAEPRAFMSALHAAFQSDPAAGR